MINLDYLCVKYGQQLWKTERIQDPENFLRKALGVLKEDGVYAMFLWLECKKCGEIREKLTNLVNEEEIRRHLLNESDKFPTDFEQFCENLGSVATDTNKLLFLKKILERTLIYGLYHAKTKEGVK